MDTLDLLKLIHRASDESTPDDVGVAPVFKASDFELTWRSAPRAVRAELDAILCSTYPATGLELLLRSGALHALVPELVAIKDLGDDPAAALHKDVWDHTKRVVAGVPAQLELRWGALMHDIGKARTRRVGPRGIVTFHNHDVIGAKMVDGIERRLGLFKDDPTLLSTVRILVLNHLRPASYQKTWSDSGVRRLLADLGGPVGFDRLMALSRADLTTKNQGKRGRALTKSLELEARIRDIYAADRAPKLPKCTMGVILGKVSRRPGPWINAIRTQLEDAMAAGRLPIDESVDFYVSEGLKMIEETSARE